MCRLLAAVFSTMALASFAGAADKFESKDGKYKIAFPAKPEEKTKEVEAPPPIGTITLHVASLDVKRDAAFMVVYNDYPEAVGKTAAQKVLRAVQDHSQGAGKLIAQGEVGDGNPPAREYVIEKDGNFYRARSYLVGLRLYQVVVVGKSIEIVTSKPADDFIASFEISN
jgi:hypothetical protein